MMTYPPIEPTTYDLVVVGTGLPESIIAAAAAAAGKSVLHLDPNSFYGSHFSSLTLDDLTTFLTSQSQSLSTTVTPSNPHLPSPSSTDGDNGYLWVNLQTRPMYSEVEIISNSPQLSEQSRKFSIDVAGPRVFYCADSSINLMLKSGASQYLEFKSVDASYMCDGDGKLSTLPDSRAAIFKDPSLSLKEKNQLMGLFKIVQQHLASGGGDDDKNSRISDEDLESPFVDYLKKKRLPPKIKSAILYGIAMTDYDQENLEVCKEVLQTKDGIDRLSLYHKSVGRFTNATGALIYPFYGQGELPQAFCRRAAVKGCLYVLRMPVLSMLIDKGDRRYKGVRLASGQDIFSHQLLLDPSFVVPSPLGSLPSNFLQESSLQVSPESVEGKIAKAICIASSSLKSEVFNILLIYPPRSLFPAQATSIRVLQIGSNMTVCPPGMFVLYISAPCDNATEGKHLLHVTVDAIFSRHNSEKLGISSSAQSEDTEELKPDLLWSALYIQDLSMGSFDTVGRTSMPDGNLNYDEVLDETEKLFRKMYPNEEFFPEANDQEKLENEEDAGLTLDM